MDTGIIRSEIPFKLCHNFIIKYLGRNLRITILISICTLPVFSGNDFSQPDRRESIALGSAVNGFPGLQLFPEKVNASVLPVASTGILQNGRTWLFMTLIPILFGLLFIIRKYEITRIKMRNQMSIARIETDKLKELDHLKSRFFANISHEFRTILTLIKGPLEQLMDENPELRNRKTFNLMHSNATRLLELINQLLDLARIESGHYKLKAGKGDLAATVRNLVIPFVPFAEQKRIKIHVTTDPEMEPDEVRDDFYYDRDIVEKIINNLLSNAIKYTPANGRVDVRATFDKKAGLAEIVVQDNGIGIPEEKLPYIFDRFYQAEGLNDKHYEGSGIGLSHVHELIKVHKGEIYVNSKMGTGTLFTIKLPVARRYFSDAQVFTEEPTPEAIHGMREPEVPGLNKFRFGPALSQEEETEKPWILIVEDRADMREYITGIINSEYRVIQAPDAKQGFRMAEEFIPDLIISDIMMADVDGFEFCRKIKTSEKTNHIPIILLTASANPNDRITGLGEGADDYLTKPFHARELLIRVNNLIQIRRALREKYSTVPVINPGEIRVTSNHKAFMERLHDLIEKNIDNYNFSVEELVKEAGMSHSQLHRKLKAVTDMSANQLIRSVRMHHAMELLQKNAGNISEIAYMVGYDDPGYFTKTFQRFHGKLPSEVMKK
ncbi:MAG: response regulator [Bacteroidales bacterium]|nr:response regulator [Bacteroidales bacterium]MBN2699644.1 response regulator [Bacteroidales bacterium]